MTSAEKTSTFYDLGLDKNILAPLEASGITSPFPIQELAIPLAYQGNDLIAQARTGTGKTYAYGLPSLQRLLDHEPALNDEGIRLARLLILVPTRELAIQVAKDLTDSARQSGLNILTVYGGVRYEDQIRSLQAGVDIVVGTVGRIVDLYHKDELILSEVSTVVLDEADEMLDLGFLDDVERILTLVANPHQTLLFSATMPQQILALARTHLNHPIHVRAESHDAQATVPDIDQFVYQAHELDKPEILGKLAQSESCVKMMIFTRTKRSAQHLADELSDRGFSSAAIHGDLHQSARERTLKKFRNGKVKILVATDVAARGIDVEDLSHVVNYEVPDDPQQYVHRIGRTGRAQRQGTAVTLIDWQDITRWKGINNALNLPYSEPVETYSTSDHLFTDLNIDPNVKGRLAIGRMRQSKEKRQSPRRTQVDSTRPSRTKRTRIRRKNGQIVSRSETE